MIAITEPSALQEHWVEVTLIVATLLLAYVTYRLFRHERGKSRETRRQIESGLRCTRVRDFDPGRIVGAYTAADVTEYFPIRQDAEISAALEEGRRVLIAGRPEIGKSHSAYNAITPYGDWFLLRPTKNIIRDYASIKLKKRSYVLLLDDLHECLEESETGSTIFDFIEYVETNSRNLKVLATIRSSNVQAIERLSTAFSRWKYVELTDWSEEEGKRLADVTKVGMASWDGTPLSVKEPTETMKKKFDSLPYEQRAVVQGMKLLKHYGIKPYPRMLLRSIYSSSLLQCKEEQFEESLSVVYALKFLKEMGTVIETYDPFIDKIEDTTDIEAGYHELLEILLKERRVDELLSVGMSWYEREVYDEAVKIFRICSEYEPKWERCHYRLGLALSRKSLWPEASVHFEIATKLKPRWSSAWFRFANVLRKLGRNDEANEAFIRGKRSKGSFDFAILNKIHVLRMNGKIDQARVELESTLDTFPEEPAAHYYHARLLVDLNRNEEAIEEYRKAIALRPNMAEAHCGLAKPLRATGDLLGAEESLKEAIRLNRDLIEAHMHLALILEDTNRISEAERELQEATTIRPAMPEVHSFYGRLLNKMKKYEQAEIACREAIRLKPEYAEAYCGLAHALYGQGRGDDAENAMSKALAIDPNLSETHYIHGELLMNMGKYEQSQQAFERAIELRRENVEAHSGLSHLFRILDRKKEAETEMKLAIDLRPSSAKLHSFLGSLQCSMKRYEEAETTFRAALRLKPNYPEATIGLSRALCGQNKVDEAIEVNRALIELGDDIGLAYFGLGHCFVLKREWNDALEAFREAVKASPTMAAAHFYLGKTYATLNDTVGAREAFKSARNLNFDPEKLRIEESRLCGAQ